MSTFLVTLIAVAVLLLVAAVGYIMLKAKLVEDSLMKGLSTIILYVCQPCLAIYTFKSSEYSSEKLLDVGIFALLCVFIQGLMLGVSYLALRKKYKSAIYRILTISTTFANCAFFGIPIIEALLPDISKDLIIYTTVYASCMNILGWTVGSAIISSDRKYISIKKIILNPATLGAAFAFLLFVLEIDIQKDLYSMITITGRMATPISMLVMGMRLAKMNFIKIFADIRIYLTIFVKELLMLLVAFGLVYFLPVSYEIKAAFFIICACPVASVVLNYSELVGQGQREAANTVLLSTMLSVVTMPLMMLLLPLL